MVPKPSGPSLPDEKVPSNVMPLAIGLKGKLLSGNNSKGKTKENASPQKETNAGNSLAPLGCTKADLFASGGGSEGQFGIANTVAALPAPTKRPYSDIISEKRSAKKQYRYECTVDGCTNQRVNGGVCVRHGAKVTRKLCSSDGCTSVAKRGGVCIRHGAKVTRKLCGSEGCTNYVVKGGVCHKHGAKFTRKQYSCERCTNQAVRGGVCIRSAQRRRNAAAMIPRKMNRSARQLKQSK